MQAIGVKVTTQSPLDMRSTYEWVIAVDTPIQMVRRWGLMPGFKAYELQSADWSHEGSSRLVTLDDGSRLVETIRTLSPDDCNYFDYTLNKFTSPLMRLLFTEGGGQWWFKASGNQSTHVTWRYYFIPRNILAYPVVWVFMHTMYKGYMLAAMRHMKLAVDRLQK
jgi:hypothetical protein